MTLLTTIIAAVAATAVWYTNERARRLKVSLLCFMFWGASLMWLVDAVAEYLQLGAAYFTPSPTDMLNDAFLGVSVVALALTVWIVTVMIKDPEGLVAKQFKKEQ